MKASGPRPQASGLRAGQGSRTQTNASIESCVRLDGDRLVAVNPPPANELEYLHSIIALLVAHHRRIEQRQHARAIDEGD